jgi:predicted SAM-dependent methyltransferase
MNLFRRSTAAEKNARPRLHIGSGQRHLPGWINIDNQRLPGVDRVIDVRKGLRFHDVAMIFAEHFLEHLPLEDGLVFLRECRRVLRPDGILRLSTPNLAWVIASHYRLDESLPARDGLFDCLRTNKAFRGWGHQFLYNRASLALALRAAGFASVTFHAYGESPHPDLRGVEGHEKSQDVPEWPHVLVAEATGVAAPEALPKMWIAEFRRDMEAR